MHKTTNIKHKTAIRTINTVSDWSIIQGTEITQGTESQLAKNTWHGPTIGQ